MTSPATHSGDGSEMTQAPASDMTHPGVPEGEGAGMGEAAASDISTGQGGGKRRMTARQLAYAIAAAGLLPALAFLAAAAMAGERALLGAAWGGGAGVLLALVTAILVGIPWDRFPLLASSGVALSFAAKFVVMFALVFLARSARDSMSPGWFFVSFAVILLTVTTVEIGGLVRSRGLTVQPLPSDQGLETLVRDSRASSDVDE